MQFIKAYSLIFLITVLSSSFCLRSSSTFSETSGIFSCYINEKPFVIDSMTASIRTITGGALQLSLSNERFVKFTFLNPSSKNIDLASSSVREAFIRYEDPASNSLGIPVKGYINITNLDSENKFLSGEFEMEIRVANAVKTLKITKGKFSNIPIVYR